ncbi:MAG TPA: outer membrane protein transport protein [Archangium sp.]|jgi:long-chain fatty acid transport protein|uniref:OmpP1/FadL family transporter n=1 Tax=Archangium sp. TaxID=1872627 RepID=UPI002ED9BCB6
MKKTLTLAILLAAGTSQAAGIAVDTQSGRATGMGSTGVASSQDASSLFYNAAGILGVNRMDAQLGGSLIAPSLSFTREGGTKQTQSPLSPPPYAYFAYKLIPNLAVGVGVFTPFGANSQWPDDFVGRGIAKTSQVATYDINPTVGFAPLDWLRLGAGVQVVYGTLDVTRALDFSPFGVAQEGTATVSASDWGFGYNVGIQADVVPMFLTLGAHYRSEVNMELAGDARFENIPPPLAAAPQLQNGPITADLTLPASVGLGLAVMPLKKLMVTLEANWVQWSSLQQILFEFENPQRNQPSVKDWHSRVNVRLGGEYGVTEALAVRAGFVYDPTPSPEETLAPDLPDADRLKVSVGAGYTTSSFRADLGYQFVMLQDQRSTFQPLPGTYSGSAHVLGLTLGYSR